ncbi:hypothetical protein G1C98_1040 [Bifidobacterium sp. DSM 109960]|uniref:Lipoprotein n=1 Tax=Bifidobacterium erythrocebi TaxID=2675325 RepID=A0A7Y0HVX9_9BIFI|nr:MULTISPECIES: hypothetical protein [Bifidobacterium]MBW3095359.1 hypothetical protein [Bifidobacterium pongonis]NMM96304.1 hypothetical protein [Bifidobacterium sp. DSM 109960]
MRNTTTRAALAATILATSIALAGCAATGTTGTAAPAQTACHRLNTGNSDPIITQCDLTLEDTRHVTCITIGVQKGITCDWAHASGTDKEPAR